MAMDRRRKLRRLARRTPKEERGPSIIEDPLQNVDAIPSDPLDREALLRFALGQLTVLGALCRNTAFGWKH
jgi:hypothetical protein